MSAARIFVIVPAAGSSSRYGGAIPKQYAALAGVPVISHTLRRLQALRPAQVLVALAPDDHYWNDAMVPAGALVAVARCGGTTRPHTVRNALAHLVAMSDCTDTDFVAVHDAARACVPVDALRRLADELQDDPAGGLLAVPVGDTIKRADAASHVHSQATVDRRGLWLAQTPQMFRCGLLRAALAQPAAADCTDEAEAMERAGHSPRLVMGSNANMKITHASDLAVADAIIAGDALRAGLAADGAARQTPYR